MKHFIKICAAVALLACGFVGCSDIAKDTAAEQTAGYGRVAFSCDAPLTNIVLKGTASNKTTTFGTWADNTALTNATIKIPVGSYTFTLTAVSDGKNYSGTSSGTIVEGATTALSFSLKEVTAPAKTDDDDDEAPETKTVGELVTEGDYKDLYQVMDWNASDYLFGRTTATTDSDKAVTPGTYGDVTVVGSKFKTKVTGTTGALVSGGYIQAAKNGDTSNCLKFAVPVNVKYITVGAKSGTSGTSTVKMTICLSDGTEKKEVSITGTSYTPAQQFEYSLIPAEDETQKVVCIYNSDTSASLNIAGISVYAPTIWEKVEGTISTKTISENAAVYEDTNDPEVTLTVEGTEATPTGSSVTIKKAEGWLNSAYVIFEDTAAGYTITCDGTAVDSELLRHYSTYTYHELSYDDGQSTWTEKSYTNVARVDVLGLKAGEHTIAITPAGQSATTVEVNVIDHDRSGYAFAGTDTPGAYKKDGTLKSNAKVVYVTAANAKTVSVKIPTKDGEVEYTGLQNILRNATLKTATSSISLDIRVIGKLSKDDLDAIDSSAEGLQIKDNVDASKNPVPITFEGVGHDATVWGFGFLIRNSYNVEVSNIGIMCFMDDGLSLDTSNYYSWMHNCDIYYGSTGGDSDQAKGDGSLDVKGKSNWQTYSYNHFWDSGKCSLCGMKSETTDSRLTYHHNWFDHSDSRHPRIRVQTVHIYNNYFDGNSKYGVGVTMGSSAFVERNFFRNPHDPMMSSRQGTDATGKGTFSGEDGGMIKAFDNKYWQLGYHGVKFQHMTNKDEGWTASDNDIDCYIVDKRTDKVPDTLKTVAGGTTYNNFDTSESLYLAYDEPESPDAALNNVLAKSGRHNPDFAWTFTNETEDANYGVITELKAALVGYKNTGLK